MSPEGFHVVDAFGGDGFLGGDEIICLLQKLPNYSIRRAKENRLRPVGELSHELLEILNPSLMVGTVLP